MDRRSRALVGYNLGIRSNQDAILSAYLMAFRDWSIPERIHQDNGADFCSQLLTGMTKATRDRLRRQHGRDWQKIIRRDAALVECVYPRFAGIVEELGIEITYAKKMAPWAKGVCERWFEVFEERCGKSVVGYCGNSALNKPEALDAIRRGYTRAEKRALRSQYGKDWKRHAVLRLVDKSDIPTLEYARTAIGEFIVEYHHTPHSAQDMGGGTPLGVWRNGTRIRRAGEDELLFLMQTRGIYKVGPNGVTFKVGGTRLGYGAGNPCLYKYTGRDVLITIDLNKPHCCYAFTPDRDNRRFIGKLDCNKRLSPMATAEELGEAHAVVERRRKVMRKARRESPAQMRTAAEELAAKRRERVAELRATGTENVSAQVTIAPVRTGEVVAESAGIRRVV